MNSGVYYIFNVYTNEVYIGSSYNMEKRMKTHIRHLNKNTHHNPRLQRSWNKYGHQYFIFTKIQECYRDELLLVEQLHINDIDPQYNCTKSTISPMLGKKHSEKTKRRLSEVHKGNKYNLGKKFSEERKRKVRERQLGTKRSEATKLKMSETAKRINSINRIDREKSKRKVRDNEGNVFSSFCDAAKFWKKSPQTICDIIKGRTEATKENIQFKYFEDKTSFKIVDDYRIRKSKAACDHRSKFNSDDIVFMREISPNFTIRELCDIFEVGKSTISRILRKQTWTHL